MSDGYEIPAGTAAKLTRLREVFADLDNVLVAFSGGVDSSLVLRVAHDVLGTRTVALTTVSPTNADDDVASAVALADELGVEHLLVDADELAIPGYAANPMNRCYLCKGALYDICAAHARERGLGTIVDGVNADDLNDYRPGLRAAEEHGVRHPLVEARLGKSELRTASRALGLATWDRPASPCLSSRFPYGTEITAERLRMVARAEQTLRDLGMPEIRVRFHGDIARIEVPEREFARLADPALRSVIVEGIRGVGFRHVALDLEGFRSGSLNDAVTRAATGDAVVRRGPRAVPPPTRDPLES